MDGEMRQNHCWGTKWDVQGEEGGANCHCGGVNAGVDEGASADLSVQVVTGKQKGVCRHWNAGGDVQVWAVVGTRQGDVWELVEMIAGTRFRINERACPFLPSRTSDFHCVLSGTFPTLIFSLVLLFLLLPCHLPCYIVRDSQLVIDTLFREYYYVSPRL